MWEIGTRVVITKSERPKAKIGTKGTVVVIADDVTDRFLVEFDKPMGGHNGRSYYRGKFGHCWFFSNTLNETTADSGITIAQMSKRKNNYY